MRFIISVISDRRMNMCRNIRKLRNPEKPPSRIEMQDASLQFVRKVSGYRIPSKKNQIAFEAAVEEVTRALERLMQNLAKDHESI